MDDPTTANQFEPTGAGSAQPESGPVKTVCIEMAADGSFKVGLEPKEPATMPGMGETESPDMEASEEAAMKPAGSIDEALDMARQLLEGDASGGMTVEQAFQGGFNGDPMPRKPGY